MKEIAKYKGCFVCGDQNDFGLKAKFYFDGSRAITEYTAERKFEGYAGILHGGITAALLDEVMIKALLAGNIFAMTVELTVRFHKAIFIGQKLNLDGRLEKQDGRLIQTAGQVSLENGEIVATAVGKYLQVRDDMKIKLSESLER